MDDDDLISLYDYPLPEEHIAKVPPADRDGARLLVVDRALGTLRHLTFRQFPGLLRRGDLLVFNDTRVVPARLQGVRTRTGGRWEGLFLRVEADGLWRIIGQTRGRLLPGESLTIPSPRGNEGRPLVLHLVEFTTEGEWLCRPDSMESPWEVLEHFGSMPLPPYLEREEQPQDRQRYQTVFASQPGAVAAPTAGLHFTSDIIADCVARGVLTANVTLHVGLGTFRPVSAERLSEHQMHSEWREIPEGTAALVNQTRQSGGRVIAVGTTSVRSLESAAEGGKLIAGAAETRLFIRPPYQFQLTDALLTNFHLPKSTLLVLVSTLAGRELIRLAYEEAIRERYRFFSYGDAMLIV